MVILKVQLVIGIFYLLIPWVITMVMVNRYMGASQAAAMVMLSFFSLITPYFALITESVVLIDPGVLGVGGGFFSSNVWAINCGVMLILSVLLLGWSVIRVRRVALRQAAGATDGWVKPKPTIFPRPEYRAVASTRPVKRVTGSPIIWKEFRIPLLSRDSRKSVAVLVAALTVL